MKRTVDENIEDVQTRDNGRRGRADKAVREQDGEQNSECSSCTKVDRTVRPDTQRGGNHLRTTRATVLSIRRERFRTRSGGLRTM